MKLDGIQKAGTQKCQLKKYRSQSYRENKSIHEPIISREKSTGANARRMRMEGKYRVYRVGFYGFAQEYGGM